MSKVDGSTIYIRTPMQWTTQQVYVGLYRRIDLVGKHPVLLTHIILAQFYQTSESHITCI